MYGYWRRLDTCPTFMTHVEDVRTSSATRSQLTGSAPFGKTVEWDADIVDDEPGKRLPWRSVERADARNEGTVTFTPAPSDRGTELRGSPISARRGASRPCPRPRPVLGKV